MGIPGCGRHRLLYRIARVVLKPYLMLRFGQKAEEFREHIGPYLLLVNHAMNLDPLLICQSFPEPMYFVASSHIFRWGFLSRLIEYLQAPIPILKGTSDLNAVRAILKRLKAGSNVCIFAEGSTTYTGATAEIAPSIGKLVKLSGVSLVTATLRGGYLTKPRWSRTYRRGLLKSGPVRRYSPEELKAMSPDEINARIRADLQVNVFEEQRSRGLFPIRYKGRHLAEGIENVLYLCPRCGRFASFTSSGDTFSCSCGLTGHYTETGFLESADETPLPFDNTHDWDRWQRKEALAKALVLPADEPIVSHDCQTLYALFGEASAGGNRQPRKLSTGRLALYRDRLVLSGDGGEYVFYLKDLPRGLTFYSAGSATIGLTDSDGASYEIKTILPRPALCYATLANALKASAKHQ